jgi:hypothetical protein
MPELIHWTPASIAAVATALWLSAGALLATVGIWSMQQEPIEPDPAEVPAPLLMGGDWEYGQPYRYVGAHRAVDEHELTRDLGKRASLLRLPGFVTGQLPVLNEDHGDRTLAEVYRGGESNG